MSICLFIYLIVYLLLFTCLPPVDRALQHPAAYDPAAAARPAARYPGPRRHVLRPRGDFPLHLRRQSAARVAKGSTKHGSSEGKR